MIEQQKDGKWLAKCDICTWKTLKQKKGNAETSLKNHINIAHKTGKKRIKDRKPSIPPEQKPEDIPSPIKEQS